VVTVGAAACFEETGKNAKGSACDQRLPTQIKIDRDQFLKLKAWNALDLSGVSALSDWVLVGWQAMKKPSPKAPRTQAASRKAPVYWSGEVTRRSDALDLEPGVFTWKDPKEIAASLKRSAEASDRKKTDSFRSAMSMLNFYINRAGGNLPASRRTILTRAKGELRKQFGRA
jgi:hypothetical protein